MSPTRRPERPVSIVLLEDASCETVRSSEPELGAAVAIIRQTGLMGLGSLVSSLGHQMNNALASIAGTAQLLETEAHSAEALTRLRHLRAETDHLAGLVDSLRLLCPHGSRRPVPTDLTGAVSQVIAIAGLALGQQGIALEADLPGTLPTVLAGEADLRWCLLQVLMLQVLGPPRKKAKSTPTPPLRITAQVDPSHITLRLRGADFRGLSGPAGRMAHSQPAAEPPPDPVRNPAADLAGTAWEACRRVAAGFGARLTPAASGCPGVDLALRRSDTLRAAHSGTPGQATSASGPHDEPPRAVSRG